MPKITVSGGPSHASAEPRPAAGPQPEPAAPPATEPESAPEPPAEAGASAYSDLSFRDLRRVLRERGMSSRGTAEELRARLAEADAEADAKGGKDQDDLKRRLNEDDLPNWDALSDEELAELAGSRDLPTDGGRDALISRLKANPPEDEQP